MLRTVVGVVAFSEEYEMNLYSGPHDDVLCAEQKCCQDYLRLALMLFLYSRRRRI
jgi:hypothetical protein